ncbi:hypothetical protein HMF7854_04155 [Sphingomonas ginkgonis]|uniref:Uncharacterized protein n=1 Tax=Sphingomonas ginkgonis TaxID=2315330 RepID=A0A429V843_9SPHN|nr:hypothetical protein [Sphingomonas ginkgonis]RST30105.1 hypothetical protein HMF7854_04155 [Sphingomonas ginkgonis]
MIALPEGRFHPFAESIDHFLGDAHLRLGKLSFQRLHVRFEHAFASPVVSHALSELWLIKARDVALDQDHEVRDRLGHAGQFSPRQRQIPASPLVSIRRAIQQMGKKHRKP